MTKKFLLSTVVFFMLCLSLNAQNKQSIRGIVLDQQSQIPLPGVNVIIEGSNPIIGTTTDFSGEFIISGLDIGKYNIAASYIGYNPNVIGGVFVGAGKQVYLTISLSENQTLLSEVVIKSTDLQNETLNSMSIVSGRTFSVEETRRYAGGMDDPARLVSAFAGVSTGNVQDNAIIIRGNNPKYVSWQLEGVEIPNPNHFSSINVIGGGFVTIFSNQLLANSDFYTGAFAAEYGNALAGVFDMHLRNGNNKEREYTFQAGLMGLDFAAEGPFIEGKPSSYLINYRYSTMALISPLIPSQQVPKYQDLSFKFNFPTRKFGTFSIWSIGALDKNAQPENTDSTDWSMDFDRFAYEFSQNTGAIGLSHKKIFGDKTFVNTSLVATANQFVMDMNRLDNNLIAQDNWYGNNIEGKYTFKSFINHKFNERHTNRTGVILNNIFYKIENIAAINNTSPLDTLSFEHGNANRFEAFSQSQIKLSANTTLNIGLHATYFSINSEFVIEPRAGISRKIGSKHKIGLAYGKHSSLEPLRVYFFQTNSDGGLSLPNANLKLTKAHHIIASYDWEINKSLRFKAEPYFQLLYDVPVITDSVFSMINFEQDFYFNDELSNLGKGQNIGIDFTFEKFFDNSIYYLLTGSVFKSSFETSNGDVYPTRYDKGFVINLLAGKEFVFDKKYRNSLSLNGRFTIAGGNKTTPVNMDFSQQQRTVYYDWTKPYSEQNPTDLFFDFSVSWRKDKNKVASIFTLQVKNVLGTPSGYNWTYNYKNQQIEKQSVVVVMPSLNYRIEF